MNNYKKFYLRITSKSKGSNLFELHFTRSINNFNVNSLRDCLLYCSPLISYQIDYVISNIQCMLFSPKSCFIISDNLYDIDVRIFLRKSE